MSTPEEHHIAIAGEKLRQFLILADHVLAMRQEIQERLHQRIEELSTNLRNRVLVGLHLKSMHEKGGALKGIGGITIGRCIDLPAKRPIWEISSSTCRPYLKSRDYAFPTCAWCEPTCLKFGIILACDLLHDASDALGMNLDKRIEEFRRRREAVIALQ